MVYIAHSWYFYYFWEFSQNEKIDLKKELDIKRLPKIIYNEDDINKLYDSISLKEQYNNQNK